MFANTEILVSSVISGIIVVVYLTSVKIQVNDELIIKATGDKLIGTLSDFLNESFVPHSQMLESVLMWKFLKDVLSIRASFHQISQIILELLKVISREDLIAVLFFFILFVFCLSHLLLLLKGYWC